MQVFFLLLTTAVVIDARCGTGFVQGPSLSDCYKFVSKGAAHWYAAEWRCLSLGGHLASVSDAVASSFLKEEVPSCCSGYYWLGGSNDDQDDSWEWSDRTQFSYTNWDTRQPVAGSPLCLAASTSSAKWSSLPCYQSWPYVCRVPATDDVCPTATPPCSDHARAPGLCTCGTDTCAAGQYCHEDLDPKCYSTCPDSGPVPAAGCQCATAYDNGDVCAAGQYCRSDGSCWTPPTAPPACPAGSPANAACSCSDVQCVKGQTCDSTGAGACSPPICPATGGAPDGGCICGNDGTICNMDDTCAPDSGICTVPAPCSDGSPSNGFCTCRDIQCVPGQTCDYSGNGGACSPPICPATGGAPAGGCICGNDGAMCNQDDTCAPDSGICTPPPPPPSCPTGSPTYAVCTCKKRVCFKGQTCDDSGSSCTRQKPPTLTV